MPCQLLAPPLLLRPHADGRTISSGLGVLGWLSDPAQPFHDVNIPGYDSSRSGPHAVTVSVAKVGIRVDPGYTATDLNDHPGHRTVEEAATGTV